MNTSRIAGRLWSKKPYRYFYVAQLPGEYGVDWGYTEKVTQAKPLSIYWQKRFRKDCERVGSQAEFYSQIVNNPKNH